MKIDNPNPYGQLEYYRLNEFEKRLGAVLPDSYRDYLLKYNGGKFENTVFTLPDGDNSSIHHVFGLHDGPDHNQFDEEPYDDDSFTDAGYLLIADDGFSNGICLKLSGSNRGAIYFYDHEESRIKDSSSLVKLASDFNEFLSSLESEDANDAKLALEYPEVFERIQAFKNEHKK